MNEDTHFTHTFYMSYAGQHMLPSMMHDIFSNTTGLFPVSPHFS